MSVSCGSEYCCFFHEGSSHSLSLSPSLRHFMLQYVGDGFGSDFGLSDLSMAIGREGLAPRTGPAADRPNGLGGRSPAGSREEPITGDRSGGPADGNSSHSAGREIQRREYFHQTLQSYIQHEWNGLELHTGREQQQSEGIACVKACSHQE